MRDLARGRGRSASLLCRAAVALGWLALAGLGMAVVLDGGRSAPLARALAWLSALLVVTWLAAHLTLHRHQLRRLPRELQHELSFKLLSPGRAGSRRAPVRRAAQGWYGGRSRSGEHPRFD